MRECGRVQPQLQLLLATLMLTSAAGAGASLERLLDVLQGVPGAAPLQRLPRHTPPRYMLDLYRSVAAPDGLTVSPTPHSANVIRCYSDRESRHRSHFFFNVSSEKTDKLLEAEFHIFKMKPKAKDQRKAKMLKSQLLEVKIFQMLPPAKSKRKRRKRLLETRRLSVHSTGWEIFSVKVAAADWIKDSESNLGLALSVRGLENEPIPKGLVRFAKGNRTDKQPLLVIFIDDSRQKSGSFLSAPEGYNKYQVPVKSAPAAESPRIKRGGGISNVPQRTKNESCARYQLYIDFERMGWAAWIISPKGYNAYQCKGHCHFPLGQNQRPTNHATMQSIASELSLAPNVLQPCCVPDKLLSISLLYFDEHGNVILKQYDDMVAASCGCH
ncbi:bone morphogenetic protein 2-A-like [Stegodyphus dumicola]|uniref:bone morphogenetic protein 2-A-like n=1 Tax=Stegodyphus dumicola TaxID=202533 RepID=UPI0015A87488|nr:bone morphogenetic protein 2-A-like [Stegodyphus dumicola]